MAFNIIRPGRDNISHFALRLAFCKNRDVSRHPLRYRTHTHMHMQQMHILATPNCLRAILSSPHCRTHSKYLRHLRPFTFFYDVFSRFSDFFLDFGWLLSLMSLPVLTDHWNQGTRVVPATRATTLCATLWGAGVGSFTLISICRVGTG